MGITLCGWFQDVEPMTAVPKEEQNCVAKVLNLKIDHDATGVTLVPHKMNKVHGQ